MLFALKDGLGIIGWFKKRFEIQTKDEQLQTELSVVKTDIVNLKNDINDVKGAVEDVSAAVTELKNRMVDMLERQDSSTRSRIKDRIAQAYRYYSAEDRRCWTKMEKEAFDGLVESYERAHGDNSFMHETCVPASLTWQIIDENKMK